MAVIALALFAVYAVVGFGIRTWLQVRRTGDSGFRGISGRAGSPEWWAGILFVTALAAAVAGPVASLVGLSEQPVLDRAWVHGLGVFLAALGIAGTFLTQLAMGESWRIGVDESEHTQLVTHGPFQLVRNPIFTAMIITGGGIALIVPNAISLVGWLLLVLAIQLQVRILEEPYLTRQHSAAFRAYTARVGRFVPGIGRLPDDPRECTV